MEIQAADEDLAQRHKQERKELQGRIQSLKKTVTKGDKKKKKDVAEEIARLEQELDSRQASELAALTPDLETSVIDEIEADEDSLNDSSEPPGEPQQRLSRAAKRRNKKAQDERERELRCREEMQRNKNGPRVVEMNAIKESLRDLGLKLYDIPADGNCLYCAVNHQLEATGRETFSVPKLRKLTADFMKDNRDEFLPFMYNESEESISTEYFDAYCKEVATTKLWGGQLELRALSNILQCPIKVIQASGPPTLQGENFKGPQLILAYHRHLYRLGEHYNSTVGMLETD